MARSKTELVTTLSAPIKFLGCSVVSFSSQLGWGLDNTSFQVELVEDCDDNDRFWGRDQELIGTARYFDLSEHGSSFYYGGIVTNWVESQGNSGRIYTVTMSDAKQLLSNITVLTDHLTWGDIIQNNYFNVYSYYEFDAYAGYCYHFGAANSSDAGMNYNNIIQGLLNIAQDYQLDSNQRPHIYSPTYGLASSNAAFTIDFGLTNTRTGSDRPINPLYNFDAEYLTALRSDALPIGPNFYRVAGPITLLDLINNICELTGRNFYTSLYYDQFTDTNVIKIHCVHLVDTFAGNYSTIVQYYNGISTDLSYGKEINMPKTRNLIVGAPVSYLSQSTRFNFYFGERYDSSVGRMAPNSPKVNAQGYYLMPNEQDISPCQNFWVEIDITKLNAGLYTPVNDGNGNIINRVYISEKDFKAAAATQQLWQIKAFSTTLDANGNPQIDPWDAPPGSLNYYIQKGYPEAVSSMRASIIRILENHKTNRRFPGADVINNNFFGQQMYHNNARFIHDIKSIYQFVADLANNHYGKKYLVRLNEAICYRYVDPETQSGQIEFSSTPTNEGGWVDPGVSVLGLTETELSSFKTQDGRIGCVVRFDAGSSNGTWYSPAPSPIVPDYTGPLDISELQVDNYISDGSTLWLRANVVDDKIYSVYDGAIDAYVPAIVIELETSAYLRPQNSLSLIAEQIMSSMEAAYQVPPNQSPTVSTEGKIVGVTIVQPGINYQVGDRVIISQAGNSSAEAEVSEVDDRGAIISIAITNGGEDYNPYVGTTTFISSSSSGIGFAGISVIGLPTDVKYCGLPHEYDPSFITVDPATGQSGIPIYNQDSVGFTDLNSKGVMKRAAVPNAAAIPMKSNVSVYGPYISANWYDDGSGRTDLYGGVNVEVDEDLAPWKFGNSATMNTAGVTRANTAYQEYPLVISETGDTRVPGLPENNLGEMLSLEGNVYGPLVNNVNVTFGSQGISTAYSFKTFSRKFGNLSAILTEQIKLVGQNRDKQLKDIRQNILQYRLLARKAPRPVAVSPPKNQATESMAVFKNTTQRVLVGESYDWMNLPARTTGTTRPASSGQRVVTALTTFDKMSSETSVNYDKKAFMSLDGIFSPVSISGAGGLPRFARPTSASNTDSRYFNPLSNPGISPYHNGLAAGHSIDLVGRETGVPVSGLISNFYEEGADGKYSNDYRFLGLRGPLVLHSWGFDTTGAPIPNENDTETAARSGIFTTNTAPRFYQDWLQKPATWPVGPVDLRFDKDRGVWSASGGSSIVIGKFCNQWPSLSNVKDPANAVKKVILYRRSEDCSGFATGDQDCPWNFVPQTTEVSGVTVPVVVEAINLFANVAAHEYQTKWCALTNNDGTYILLAAEC